MSAYTDLNLVRAGIVNDPKDYRWCGYGEAIAGVEQARVGLCKVMKRISRQQFGLVLEEDLKNCGWRSIAGRYSLMLFDQGREVTKREGIADAGKITKRGYTAEQVEKEEERRGELSLSEQLRVKVRYFTDGAIIGSQKYVNEVFEETKGWFGPNRKRGAKRMRGFSESGGLSKFYSAREVL